MIGFGQAGGKVVDRFLEYDDRTGSAIIRAAVAVNTAKADLLGFTHVSEKKRVLIGQARVRSAASAPTMNSARRSSRRTSTRSKAR